MLPSDAKRSLQLMLKATGWARLTFGGQTISITGAACATPTCRPAVLAAAKGRLPGPTHAPCFDATLEPTAALPWGRPPCPQAPPPSSPRRSPLSSLRALSPSLSSGCKRQAPPRSVWLLPNQELIEAVEAGSASVLALPAHATPPRAISKVPPHHSACAPQLQVMWKTGAALSWSAPRFVTA